MAVVEVGTEKDGAFPIWVKLPAKLPKCLSTNSSSVKVAFKTKLELTPAQLKALKEVLDDYGLSAAWLRQSTRLTRQRRKWLQAILFESGSGHDTCWLEKKDWAYDLHLIWHELF